MHNLILRSDKFMNMNAVGIDVSKVKSMVAILRSYGEIQKGQLSKVHGQEVRNNDRCVP